MHTQQHICIHIHTYQQRPVCVLQRPVLVHQLAKLSLSLLKVLLLLLLSGKYVGEKAWGVFCVYGFAGRWVVFALAHAAVGMVWLQRAK